MKVGKILGCLKFGAADSPRVRGGQSAVHETCPPEALQRSCQPQKYTADSLPKDHGRSACAGQNLLEAVSVGCQCKDSMADGPPGYSGQSATGQNGGVGQTCLIMDVTLTPHQTTHNIQKALYLSLSSTWGRRQGQGFLAWFPDGPRTSPDSSQDCASCPLGISMNP